MGYFGIVKGNRLLVVARETEQLDYFLSLPFYKGSQIEPIEKETAEKFLSLYSPSR